MTQGEKWLGIFSYKLLSGIFVSKFLQSNMMIDKQMVGPEEGGMSLFWVGLAGVMFSVYHPNYNQFRSYRRKTSTLCKTEKLDRLKGFKLHALVVMCNLLCIVLDLKAIQCQIQEETQRWRKLLRPWDQALVVAIEVAGESLYLVIANLHIWS